MWSGFGRSVNTYMVKLQEIVGADRVVDAAKRLGIQFRAANDARIANDREYAKDWGAFTLGVSGATPLEMANAYATLAADGKYCEPTPVQEIRDHGGNKLDVANPRCEQRINVQVARSAIDAARCPVGDNSRTDRCDGGTYREARGIVGHPLAGKTGTTDKDKTASLILTTKQLTVAGILADPDWAQTNQRMLHPFVNPAVAETLRDAMKGVKGIQFTPPSGKIVNGDQRTIPDVRCRPLEEARSRIRSAGFQVSVSSGAVDSPCPPGTAAGTNPDGRTIKGGVVIINISNGKGAPGAEPGGPPPGPGRPGRPGRTNTIAACIQDPSACLD
jgi:membrane peptidoglycan carboxypeptidase